MAGRKGDSATVPTFTTNRLTASVPSFSPAASPRLRRSLSPWPPGRPSPPASESPWGKGVRCFPAQIRQVWSRCVSLEGVPPLVPSSYTSPSRLPDPGRLAVPARPVVVEAAPALPRTSGVRLPPPSPGCCDSPEAEPFHLRSVSLRLVAHIVPAAHPVRVVGGGE